MDLEQQSTGSPAKPRHRLRLTVSLVPLGIALAGLVLAYWKYRNDTERAFLKAVAEADRHDPGWRLEEIEARRVVLPPSANGAVVVAGVSRLLPRDWQGVPKNNPPAWTPELGPRQGIALYSVLALRPPENRLEESVATLVRAEAHRLREPIERARDLVRFPKGRTQLVWAANPMDTLLPHVETTRSVAHLLDFDTISRTQAADFDGALESGLALLNAGRSLGDEPIAITQLVRTRATELAIGAAERTLARGTPSDAAIARLQSALAAEYNEPVEIHALRGERAAFWRFLENLDRGACNPFRDDPFSRLIMTGPWGHLIIRRNQVLSLRLMTEAVEIGRKAPRSQPPLWEHWQQEFTRGKADQSKRFDYLTYLLLPAVNIISDAAIRTRANSGACVVMLAAERYRRARGGWPESAAEIERALGLTLPRDPYDERPYKLARTGDGLIVYSVGPDLVDNGGTLFRRTRSQAKTDTGCRLWNTDRRGQETPVVEEAPTPVAP